MTLYGKKLFCPPLVGWLCSGRSTMILYDSADDRLGAFQRRVWDGWDEFQLVPM